MPMLSAATVVTHVSSSPIHSHSALIDEVKRGYRAMSWFARDLFANTLLREDDTPAVIEKVRFGDENLPDRFTAKLVSVMPLKSGMFYLIFVINEDPDSLICAVEVEGVAGTHRKISSVRANFAVVKEVSWKPEITLSRSGGMPDVFSSGASFEKMLAAVTAVECEKLVECFKQGDGSWGGTVTTASTKDGVLGKLGEHVLRFVGDDDSSMLFAVEDFSVTQYFAVRKRMPRGANSTKVHKATVNVTPILNIRL